MVKRVCHTNVHTYLCRYKISSPIQTEDDDSYDEDDDEDLLIDNH